jgi:chromate transporter
MRAGIPGALLAFILWSTPALVVLIAAGVGIESFDLVGAWWLAGLPPAGVALVYPAAYKIGTKCCADRLNKVLALTSALVVVLATTDSRIEVSTYWSRRAPRTSL